MTKSSIPTSASKAAKATPKVKDTGDPARKHSKDERKPSGLVGPVLTEKPAKEAVPVVDLNIITRPIAETRFRGVRNMRRNRKG